MGQVWSNPIQNHERLLEHAKITGNKKEEAKEYHELGKAYEQYRQFGKAKKCFNNALKIAKELKDEEQESSAYLGLASAYALTNEFGVAMEYTEKAFKANLIIRCNSKISKFLHEFEIEKLSTSDTNKGWSTIIGETNNKRSFHTSESADMQNTQHETPNKASKHLEKVFAALAKYKKTVNDCKDTFGIPPSPEGDDLEISAYLWLGHSLLLIGQPKESLECYKEVIKRATQFKDKKMEMSAYLGLGSAYSNMEDSESSIKYFLKALTMAEEYDDNNLKRETHLKLGKVYYTAGKFNEALKSYRKAQKISADLGARKDEQNPYFMQAQEISCGQSKKKDDANIWFMLGKTFQQLKQEEKAIESFEKAMVISIELKDTEMVIIARERLGISYLTFASVCRKDRDYERAIELYKKALHIFGTNPDYQILRKKALTSLGVALFRLGRTEKAFESIQEAQKLAVKDNNTAKEDEAVIFLLHAVVFRQLKKDEKAIEFFQKALHVSKELEDQEIQMKAVQGLGTLYINLASNLIKDCDFEEAIKSYEKTLNLSRRECNDNLELLQEKALTGLGVVWFNLGDVGKAIESLQKARALGQKEPPNADSFTEGKTKEFREEDPITDDWVDAFIKEACNPDRTERLPTNDLVRMEKYIKKISSPHVHTHQISVKKPFTEEIRKAMTENVKISAYRSLLGKNVDRTKNAKFVNEDQEVFNFAKDEVSKNASVKKPARLNKTFALYMKSIGQIVCGKVQGTCFLVTDTLVITNYHVYRMIKKERNDVPGNSNIPITIIFDYLDHQQKENVVKVEVDEEQHPKLENPYLDYKLFYLKQNEALRNRVPLGPMVRNWQLCDGRVVILGHPNGDEMQDEVCIVVGYRNMLERIRDRKEWYTGVHMTNEQLLYGTEDYQGCLAYDTSFFSGASGSPVFELNGNIVAMHAQGYTLERRKEDVNNQPQNAWNLLPVMLPTHENVPTQLTSLMEFGVQFFSKCRDIKQRHGETFAKQIFPNFELRQGEEPIDTT